MADNVSTPDNAGLALSYRKICIILLIIIAAMLVLWRPWDTTPPANARTISVTGEATVKAEPDEFVFNPSYEFNNANKDEALKQASAKSDEVVAKLKELGVEDGKIKTNTNAHDKGFFGSLRPGSDQTTYTLQLTVTVSSRDQAQKIQDYLATTTPTGAVSPQPSFSDVKRKELESQARDQASKEAREKADQSAKNLGFKIGKVKSVEDGAGFGVFPALRGMAEDAIAPNQSSGKLGVQPGENDLNYSVKVTYYLR